ncbi:MAG: hypothetical protein RMM28_07085, partial [Thermoleophilia bacterium]|nr:hypothetical protein [Gaiellaceae bacterium]MDW8338883.1 hypothetical protein [Thermoleophilia bacterium]
MTKRVLTLLSVALLALLVVSVPTGAATGRWEPGRAIELRGTLGDAPYRVVVPSNWNGTLLVFAHGYGRNANQPIPITPNYGSAGQEQSFLDRGY